METGYLERVERARRFFRQQVAQYVDSLAEAGFLINRSDLYIYADAIAGGLDDYLSVEIDTLNETVHASTPWSSYPEGWPAWVDDQYERLVDAFRIKQVDSSSVLCQVIGDIVKSSSYTAAYATGNGACQTINHNGKEGE